MYMLLHYLDKPACREDPVKTCKLHHITCALRGNWVKTKGLVDFAIKRGWVTLEGDTTYRITASGREYLFVLRPAFERWDPNAMARLMEREK